MGREKRFFSRVHVKGFCAFCKAERRYVAKKHMSLLDLCLVALLSGVLSAGLWQPLDPRSLTVFAFFFGVGEIFIYLRWRSGVICKHCGFDPVLYKVSPTRARDKVREFYDTKTLSPEFMLSNSPILELYKKRLHTQRVNQKLQRVKSRSQVPAIKDSDLSAPSQSTSV